MEAHITRSTSIAQINTNDQGHTTSVTPPCPFEVRSVSDLSLSTEHLEPIFSSILTFQDIGKFRVPFLLVITELFDSIYCKVLFFSQCYNQDDHHISEGPSTYVDYFWLWSPAFRR